MKYAGCLIALLVVVSDAAGIPIKDFRLLPRSGVIDETTPKKEVMVTVTLSDFFYQVLKPDPMDPNAKAWPDGMQSQTFGTDVPKGANTIFGKARFKDLPAGAYDFKQTTKILRDSGETADLSFESVFFNPTLGTFELDEVFATIADTVGYRPVSVPDLFADTNGDGTIGEGDILYSIVDLDTYLQTEPAIGLGQRYTITNGVVPELPGMRFSRTPFVFDPAAGFNPIGGSASLFDGEAVSDGVHDVTPMPEPHTFGLVGVGVLGLLLNKLRTWEKAQ
jgi:hypothetical protein